LIIAFSDTGGRTDATHAALATAQALHALGDIVTVIRVAAEGLLAGPLAGGPIAMMGRSRADQAVEAVREARDADHTVILDLPPDGLHDPSLRALVTVPVFAVGPHAIDEALAVTLADTREEVGPPTWFLGCRRSGNPAAFQKAMSREGAAPHVLPVTLPQLTRAEATALEAGAPGGRILRSGILLASCLLRLTNDPTVPRLAGPAAAARSEAERIAVTADDRRFGERLRDLADALDAFAQGQAPTAEDIADAPVLDNWKTEILTVPILTGTVSAHPGIRNGRPVRTTQIFASDNATWARTLSRLYVLGAPASADRARPH
jgi:hypothetical protein